MATTHDGQSREYTLSGRRFTGTREEVLQQVDELIETLLAWRQSLLCELGQAPSSEPQHTGQQSKMFIVDDAPPDVT